MLEWAFEDSREQGTTGVVVRAEVKETEAEEEFVGLEARDFDAGRGLQEVEMVREHQIEQEMAKGMVKLVGQSSKVLEGGTLWNFCK